MKLWRAGLSLALLFLTLLETAALGRVPATGELDAFMARVLEKRDINWESLHGYVFNEVETLEFKGLAIAALANFRREYVWFVRDGYLVRSPVRANGIAVPRDEQVAYEDRWLKKKDRDSLERDSFFKFKFEPGRYLFAGRKQFEGREAVVVEYYPRPNRSKDEKPKDRWEREGERIEEQFYKTSRVTMWIAPEEHQILRITFDNVGLDFLPFRWIVRMDELSASMTMHKPLGDVWLPREMRASGNIVTASATLSARYSRVFTDYAKTDVRVKLRFETDDPEKRD
jgi:hypothetical protein